jgi:hypothetical protein
VRALTEAISRTTPCGAGTGLVGAAQSLAFTGTSSAETAVDASIQMGAWVTFTADQDCFIRFGPTGLAAAAAGDFPLFQGTQQEWWVETDRNAFRVIQKTTAGTLSWYRSSR